MKKSTLVVATLLTVLAAPVASVAYADDAAPAATAPAPADNNGKATDDSSTNKDSKDMNKDAGSDSSN